MKKYIYTILMVLTATACAPSSDTKESSPPPTPQIPQFSFIKTFEGSVGTYAALLKIKVDNDSISGGYYYQSNKKELKLIGHVQSDNSYTIQEFDTDGNITGVFEGSLLNENKLEGKWSKPNGHQPATFTFLSSNTPYQPVSEPLYVELAIDRYGKYSNPPHLQGPYQTSVQITKSVPGTIRFNIETASPQGCTGQISGSAELLNSTLAVFSSEGCEELKFTFKESELTITEKSCEYHGMGCYFAGTYQKIPTVNFD